MPRPDKCPQCGGKNLNDCGFGQYTCLDCQWVEGSSQEWEDPPEEKDEEPDFTKGPEEETLENL